MRVKIEQVDELHQLSASRGRVHDITTLANEASDDTGSDWRRLTVYLLKN